MSGLRAAIRAYLYRAHKYDLGCPTEAKCDLYARQQESACASCPKHLTPVEEHDPAWAMPRLSFLIRIDSMVQIGCTFHADDLPLSAWRDLVDLRIERQRIEARIMKQKHQTAAEQQKQQQAVASARKLDKIPPPGQPIFKRGAR